MMKCCFFFKIKYTMKNKSSEPTLELHLYNDISMKTERFNSLPSYKKKMLQKSYKWAINLYVQFSGLNPSLNLICIL